MLSPQLAAKLTTMKKRWFPAFIAIAITACSAPEASTPTRPDEFSLQGIDVSHHQGRIDWDNVAADGIDFAFIKATEGTDWIDPRGLSNWKNAKDAGLRVGAYHYYLLCETGMAQAEHFIDMVPIDASALPPVIDLEHAQNCGLDQPQEEVRAEISVMISKLRHHYGQHPILYTTNAFYRDWLQEAFPANPIWIRDIQAYPELPDGRDWTIWQYSHRGRVAGIDGEVDRNVMAEGDF